MGESTLRELIREVGRENTAAKTVARSAGSPRHLLLAPPCVRGTQSTPRADITREFRSTLQRDDFHSLPEPIFPSVRQKYELSPYVNI